MASTTPFTGPHGSFAVTCGLCGGRGWFYEHIDCLDEGCPTEDCCQCNGNGAYWDCVDDLCAALIDDWNW